MSTEKELIKEGNYSLEKIDDVASVDVKDVADSEKLSDYESKEYLVKDYAHDVAVKVCSALSSSTSLIRH